MVPKSQSYAQFINNQLGLIFVNKMVVDGLGGHLGRRTIIGIALDPLFLHE